MTKDYLETGRIVSMHGVRGEVKIEPWSDSPQFVANLKALYLEDGTRLEPERMRAAAGMVLAKLRGVDDRDAAELLRGKIVYLDRREVKLPAGRFFVSDLVGLRVEDAENGKVYGTVFEVSETGANDVYHIRRPDGTETLIPAIPQVVLETDVAGGVMRVRPLPGLFDDEGYVVREP